MAVFRTWLIGLAVAAIWLLSVYGQSRPAPLGPDAPAAQFSAARADAALARLLGGERPHPAGSAENAAIHARLRAELAALGVTVTPFSRFACYSGARWGAMECASVTDLIGEVVPGAGKAIVMMAHMDSVPAGPGAADDGSGVATILETIRALKAVGIGSRHPILALFTDGEESGLLGAAAFVRDPQWRARTGVVLNIEARGNQGPSLLFQTSPGDGRLIDLYAGNVGHYATSSLYDTIYKFLPNDTDLTPFLDAKLTGYNFAFIGNVAHYHTPLDRRTNIDPQSLQQHGENLLGLTRALAVRDFASLKGGDAIYVDVLGVWLPRMAVGWALPLALMAFVIIAIIGWLERDRGTTGWRRVLAGLMPLALLFACAGAGFVLHAIAVGISGQSDPGFAHPLAMRLALAFGVFAAVILTSCCATAIACWLWLAGLAVYAAVFLTGASPYFLFPSLVAAVALLAARLFPRARIAGLSLAALSALVLWIGLVATGETLMGLGVYLLFTVPAAFGLIALLPLMPQLERRAWMSSIAAAAALALVAAVTAGLQPAYGPQSPQRLNLHYVEADGRALWTADPVRRLPAGLRHQASFSATPRPMPGLLGSGYAAPAGAAQFSAPTAEVSRDGMNISIRLHGSTDADGMLLTIPKEVRLVSAAIGDWKFKASGRFTISCATADCRNATIILGLSSTEPFVLSVAERRIGLPRAGTRLIAARGDDAVPSQYGDATLLAAKVAVPGP